MPHAAPTCCTVCNRRTCTCERTRQDTRPSAHARGYDRRWQKVRARYLAQHPLCNHCSTDTRPVVATQVDHVIPHKGNRALFNDPGNLQGLCHSCHSKKTMQETRAGSSRQQGGGGVIF